MRSLPRIPHTPPADRRCLHPRREESENATELAPTPGAYPTEGPTSPVAVWLSSLTAAYVVVKLLVPVRLAASFALAPWLARRVLQPLARRVRRRRS